MAVIKTMESGFTVPWNRYIGQPDVQWYVLHTKPRQEKKLAETLCARQVAYYLPLIRKNRYYGKKKMTCDLPLFPGYLFLLSHRDQAFEADRTQRVVQILEVPNQQQLEEELRNLWQTLEQGDPMDPYPYLQTGIPVEVTAGPLKGVRGIIEDRNRRNRLILRIEVLGQATSLEIDGSLLEPI